ncbi:54S ribosomal protein L23, mitochondrial [Psilocybe cubensis]|uniref:Large ribosomal subunit protein uL23m n=2 Tax=Psilocybe cubensis TaxID=181762 RepID=A0A8H7XUY2_PSICU|nr:54S ribosomal protein L23, mitochondrial [Psilocybe cubensis]KAH9479461.1 54S ribosomal protein L23, mitochondrial [Psilocybe cubensis]
MLKLRVFRRCPGFQRTYATQPPLPELANIARTASTPLAVRLRRRKQFGATAVGDTDATEDGLTPTEQARYTRLKAQGLLETKSGTTPTAKEWLDNVNSRRSRIRGIRRKVVEGAEETEVLGQKVYLPNIVLRLVRNHTQPGQPYNPYEATFRIPQSVTKTDLRSLLLAVYGVKTTYIRTDNYISPWHRTMDGYERKPFKTYKRAVVGLVDPFYYPHRLEDMPQQEREEREKYIEKNFSIKHTRSLQKEELMRMTKGQGKFSWKLNPASATKRKHILRMVAERRNARESAIGAFAEGIQALRRDGQSVTFEAVRGKALGHPLPPSSQTAPSTEATS